MESWLTFLKANHPHYKDFIWNHSNLAQLPVDGSVLDQLTIHEVDDDTGVIPDNGPMADDDDTPEVDGGIVNEAAVPNFQVGQTELNRLQNRLENPGVADNSHQVPIREASPPLEAGIEASPLPADHLELPAIRPTPLNEFNQQFPLLSLACPSLFPRGEADYSATRPIKIKYHEYLEHAMRWHDGRFARHHTFRYIALNTLMRQQAHTQSRYYVSTNHQQPVSRQVIQESLANADAPESRLVLGRIVRSASQLKGTRPFWHRRKVELEAFAHCLGVPSAFITLTPADYHWQSLYRHMPDFQAWMDANDENRHKLSKRLLQENPHIAAHHFWSRSKLFREIVLLRKFNLDDYWVRFEWQGRGSSHSHGLLWLKLAPNDDLRTPAGRAAFATTWGYHVMAANINPTEGRADGSPLSVDPLATEPTFQWLNRVINRVQKHECSGQYCLRLSKKDVQRVEQVQRARLAIQQAGGVVPAEDPPQQPKPSCRFLFPRPLRETAELVKRPGNKFYSFEAERNDANLNPYNPLISLSWLANTDLSPCTSKQAVINYAGKYCTKAEAQTSTYADIAKGVLPHIATNNPMMSLVSKIMNKLIGERDYSAQEISHILLGLPLYEDSRLVQVADCRPYERHSAPLNIDAVGEVEEGSSAYSKYLNRPALLAELTFVRFLDTWNFRSKDPMLWAPWRPPAKTRVINYFPRYKGIPGHTQWPDFCRVKVTLNHPHSAPNDLLRYEGQVFAGYVEAYEYCIAHHNHEEPDFYDKEDGELVPDEDEFQRVIQEEAYDLEDWQEMARQYPGLELETEPEDLLGVRTVDLQYNWLSHISRYTHPLFSTKDY